jgi:predicted aconitase with swiveling domain
MMGGVRHLRKSGRLVLNAVNPIMVQGAAFADFTMISGFDRDITQAIANGAMVEVDPTGRCGYTLNTPLDYGKCLC